MMVSPLKLPQLQVHNHTVRPPVRHCLTHACGVLLPACHLLEVPKTRTAQCSRCCLRV
jgi:hypothetical protein